MEFAIFFSYQRIYPPEHYAAPPFEEKVVEAAAAEQLGYDMVWVPEHHLIHFMQCPNALMLAQHVGRERSLRIGTMATLLTYRQPLITAAEIALTDQILGGRLELGVGRGAYAYEFERMGVPFAESKERFQEALAILERIWHSEHGSCEWHGKHFDFEQAAVWPRPVQAPHPPVWVAGMTPPTVEWAVREGYHVSNWPFIRPMSVVEDIAGVFHRTREEMGVERGAQKLTILRGAFPTSGRKDLDHRIDQALINHRINQRLHHFTQNADPQGYVAPEHLDNEPTRAEVHANLIFGDPAECLAKMEEYHAAGVDQIMLMFDFGPSHEEVMEAMKVFAEEVIAPFRAKYGPARSVGSAGACAAAGVAS